MNEELNGIVDREVEIEIGNDIYLYGVVRIAFEYENCECSSEVGEQWITRKWQQLNIDEVELLRYYFCNDEGDDIDRELTPGMREEIEEQAIQEFIESEY